MTSNQYIILGWCAKHVVSQAALLQSNRQAAKFTADTGLTENEMVEAILEMAAAARAKGGAD